MRLASVVISVDKIYRDFRTQRKYVCLDGWLEFPDGSQEPLYLGGDAKEVATCEAGQHFVFHIHGPEGLTYISDHENSDPKPLKKEPFDIKFLKDMKIKWSE
jgi:hypothetical protein